MSDMKKDTFMSRMKEKVKNKGLVYASAAVIATCTALVFHECGDSIATFGKAEPMCESVRGDNICYPCESYPYMRGAEGKILLDREGKRVPNPNYSIEDCHEGDRVAQTATKLADLRNAAGEPVESIMEKFLDGRPITLPLEGEGSIDVVMQAVRDNPCAARTEGGPEISRPRVTGDLVKRVIVQRDQPQIEEMFLHPESLRPGDNYFVTINGYEETCDATLPVCTPDMVTACFCANHVDCRPPEPPAQVEPPTCGNAKNEPGEACDFRSRRARGGCQPEHHCTRSCTCERDREPPRCGDNETNGNDECDPPGSACGEGGTCSPQCRCNEPVRPNIPPGGPCPSEVTGLFRGRANALKTGSALSTVRSACGPDSQSRSIQLTVQVRVQNGYGTVESISGAGCSGIPTSLVNLSGIAAGVDSCVTPIPVTIPPG